MVESTVSNSQRKRQLREQALVAQKRAERAEQGDITKHRAEELYWKTRNPNPDWHLAFSGSSHVDWDARSEAQWQDRHGTSWRLKRHGRAISFPDRPGLVLLPGHLSSEEQASLVADCLTETTGPACRTNLDTHYHTPPEGWWKAYCQDGRRIIEPRARSDHSLVNQQKRIAVDLAPMSRERLQEDTTEKGDPEPGATVQHATLAVLIRKLRWSIIGLEYHWGTKSYKWDKDPMPMPSIISRLSNQVVTSIPWTEIIPDPAADSASWASEYRPEAGVVNFYQFRDTLTAHIDQSEVDAVKPLVSFSLGPSAIFLVGGPTRDDQPLPLLLNSGDVVVMAGPSRRVFHGVPRIRDDIAFTGLDDALGCKDPIMADFLRITRMNVNVRHVFPD